MHYIQEHSALGHFQDNGMTFKTIKMRTNIVRIT
uniref:Uncharacterized protein n=1 Tax=Anguilla anguilla TaxID=7936 RepID=A0A0E9SPB9_ANGAN